MKKSSKSHRYFKDFSRLKPYLKKTRWAYLIGVIFLVVTDAGQIMIPRLVGRAIDLIAEGPGNAKNTGGLMLIVIALALVIALGRYGWRHFILGSARRLEKDLRHAFYTKLLTLSSSFYSRHKIGDLMARATNDLEAIRMATGMALIAFIDGLFMTVVILTMLFIAYGFLGLIVIIPLPLMTFSALIFGRLIGPLFQRVQEKFALISAHVKETLSGVRVIKSFVKEKRALSVFAEINTDYGRANMALARFWGLIFPAMRFLAGLMILLLFFFGGQRVLLGQLSPGSFVAILSYLGMLVWPAMGVGWVITMLQRGAASMRRLNEILDEVPDIIDLPKAFQHVPSGDVEFRALSYRYPSRESVLENVSFFLPQGSSMGLLGRTGSGKSTIVKLIPRLINPSPNNIFIGNRDICSFQRSALRQALGVVTQDIYLFSQTIRENIRFANPDATGADIDNAVEVAGLSADLPFFPQGLETTVGEKGVTLSGGQKQRLAIARALIANPEILILDNALSAVDSETEERILDNLFDQRKGRSTLMISHRVSALARCEKTLVLEDGRISHQGNHEELLLVDGFYREIAEWQKLQQLAEEEA